MAFHLPIFALLFFLLYYFCVKGTESGLIDRIKEVRKYLGFNQSEFAFRIGLTQAGISMLELGKNKLTEKNIKHLCATFNIDERWLRTGEGKMFRSVSPYEKELLEMFGHLPEEMQGLLLDIAKSMLNRSKK